MSELSQANPEEPTFRKEPGNGSGSALFKEASGLWENMDDIMKTYFTAKYHQINAIKNNPYYPYIYNGDSHGHSSNSGGNTSYRMVKKRKVKSKK